MLYGTLQYFILYRKAVYFRRTTSIRYRRSRLTDTQLCRDCLADIIMKVLEKPLSVEETHAILDKARGFGGESKAPAGKKPRGKQA